MYDNKPRLYTKASDLQAEKMPGRRFGRRGLEPFVADILLVIIGITVASALLGFSSSFTSARLAETSGNLNCTLAELSITDVYISGNEARAIVRNPSRTSVSISGAKLFHRTGQESILTTGVPFAVPPGTLRMLEFVGAPACENFDAVALFTPCPDLKVRFSGSPKCA